MRRICRFRDGFIAFGNANGIDNIKAFFRCCVRRNFFQFVVGYYSTAATFHLRIQDIGPNVAHEKYDFQRLNVCSRCNKRNRYGNTKVLFNTKISNKGVGISRRICDLLNKLFRYFVISKLFGKNFFDQFDNFSSVLVIYGKNQCFRDRIPIFFAIGI